MGIGGPILLIIFLHEALAGSTMSSPDATTDPSLLCDEYEQLTLDGLDEPLSLMDPPFCVIAGRDASPAQNGGSIRLSSREPGGRLGGSCESGRGVVQDLASRGVARLRDHIGCNRVILNVGNDLPNRDNGVRVKRDPISRHRLLGERAYNAVCVGRRHVGDPIEEHGFPKPPPLGGTNSFSTL